MRRLGQLAVRGELRQACNCDHGWRPGLVLDPFLGSGTVALAAIAHQRDWLGIELNPDYAAIAERRIAAVSLEQEDAAA
jgi:tRNA/tmRNA/rRNA uracil-C5-methylase (TrmA/RlmC/RlmD family)